MDYAKLLEQIEPLNAPRLQKLALAHIHYLPAQTVSDPHQLFDVLESLGQVTGWITWPDQVESISEAKRISPNHPMPPLEGELLTQDQRCVRLHYRDQAWHLVTIQVSVPDAATPANALQEPITLANKARNQPDLAYTRIWIHDPELGLITRDAIFQGFTGGKL